MKLNHLDLQVSDVPATVLLFERLAGLTLQTSRTSPALAILHDDGDFVLVLQRNERARDAYPEGFHLGFYVERIEDVHEFHTRATGLGYEVSEVIRNRRGTMVYCRAPDGFSIEVNCRSPAP